jgi:hypothetical protein
MRKAASVLVMLAFLGSARAGEKVTTPTQGPGIGPAPLGAVLYEVKIKGLENFGALMVGYKAPDLQYWRDNVRSGVFLIGLSAGNQVVMSAAPNLVFPEWGDSKKDASGSCYCNATIQKEPLDEFTEVYKTTGKGKCEDGIICFLKGFPGKVQ